MKRNLSRTTKTTAFCLMLIMAVTQSGLGQEDSKPAPRRTTIQVRRKAMLLDLDFSRSSKWIVTGGDAIRVFETQSGKIVSTISSAPLTRCVRFSPTEEGRFTTTSDDGKVRVFEVGAAKPKLVINAHPGHGVNGLAYSPDGKTFATASIKYEKGQAGEGQFKIWNSKTGEELFSKTLAAVDCRGVAFSPKGESLAVTLTPRGETKSKVEIYDTREWKLKATVRFSPGFAINTAFSPDGKMIVIAGGECEDRNANSCMPTGKIWIAELDSDTEAFMLRPEPRHGYFRSVSFSRSGRSFVTGTSGRNPSRQAQLQSRDSRTGKLQWTASGGKGDAYGARLSPDGILAAYCESGHIYLVDATSGDRVHEIAVELTK